MKTTLNQNHTTNRQEKSKSHLSPVGYRVAFALVIALLIGIASRFDAVRSRLSHAMDVPVLVENLMVTKPIPAATTLPSQTTDTQVLGAQIASVSATPLPTLSAIKVNFAKMIGATVGTQGVGINFVGRKIVNQDGSGGQSNETTNLYGTRLNVTGNFHVQTHISGLSGAAIFSVYAKPPLIYDEFRFDPGAVMVRVEKTNLTVDVWGGVTQAAVTHKTFPIANKTDFDLAVENRGTTIAVLIDGAEVGNVPSSSIFKSGQAWFGFDNDTPNGHFLVTSFDATPLDTGKVTLVDVPTSLPVTAKDPNAWATLAGAKYPGKTIGAAVALGPLVSDPAYYALATGGWYSTWTTENALKAQFVHPQPNVYAFEEADAIVDLAQKNHIAIHGHALVFGEANPAWMQTTPANQLESVMKSHITTIMSRYKGKIATWDVVNEPLGDDYWDGPVELRNHIWYKAMGASYIDKAFIAAHAADPNALLFLNEWGLEADSGRFDGFMTLLEGLLQRGVPINGVGFQAHVYESGDEINQAQLKDHFQQIADLGKKYNHPLKARISEMDVYGHNTSNQTTQFTETLKTCMEDPTCISFSMWGITEKYGSTSWIDEDDGTLGIGDGLPFGAKEEKLNAVTSMQSYLGAVGTTIPTPTPRPNRRSRRARG